MIHCMRGHVKVNQVAGPRRSSFGRGLVVALLNS